MILSVELEVVRKDREEYEKCLRRAHLSWKESLVFYTDEI